MEQLLDQREAQTSLTAMTARVMADAARAFAGNADAAVIERYAAEAVAALWSESVRITSFIPVLALRQVRESLDARPVADAVSV